MSTPTEIEKETIQLEISKEHKKTLEIAAKIRGLTLNDYLLEIALNIATPESIVLSQRDWEIVTSAIENPPLLNPKLTAAIKKYKQEYQ